MTDLPKKVSVSQVIPMAALSGLINFLSWQMGFGFAGGSPIACILPIMANATLLAWSYRNRSHLIGQGIGAGIALLGVVAFYLALYWIISQSF